MKHRIKIILGGTLLSMLLIGAFFPYDTDDADQIVREAHGNEIFTYVQTPLCISDGVGLERVLFGVMVTKCETQWFVLFNAFSFQVRGDEILSNRFGHQWGEYVNKELGFTVQYPLDVAYPYEAPHPPSIDGIFPGAKTVTFYGDDSQSKYIYLWVQETSALNAQEWFERTYGSDGSGHYISATSTVAGVPAVTVREVKPGKGLGSYNLHFVHNGNEWSLYIHDTELSQEAVQYIQQSFRFLNWWEKI